MSLGNDFCSGNSCRPTGAASRNTGEHRLPRSKVIEVEIDLNNRLRL